MKDFKTKNISEEQKPETKEAEKKLEKKTNIYILLENIYAL